MILLFFLAAGIVLYTYAGYPVCIALLARYRSTPWTRQPQSGTASVILPVHNGIAMLPAKMQSLKAIGHDLLSEIIVVCDGCTDGAEDWLATWDDPRVRTIVLPDQVGKATALRHAMPAATGEFLLFIDVRPEVTGDAVRELLSNFADPTVGCVAGELRLIQNTAGTHTTSAVSGLYWRYEQWMRNNEAAFDSPVGVYGGFYAIRRNLATLPPDGLILDDMFQPLSIIRKGYRSVVDANAIVVDRWPATTKGEFQRKVRTLVGNFQLVQLAPWTCSPGNRVAFQFVSHKLLRLVAPYCLVVTLLTACSLATHSLVWSMVAVLQALVWIMALLSLRVRLPIVGRAAGAAAALLVLNAAAIRALWVFLVTPAPLWKIWNVTKTTSDAQTSLAAASAIGQRPRRYSEE